MRSFEIHLNLTILLVEPDRDGWSQKFILESGELINAEHLGNTREV